MPTYEYRCRKCQETFDVYYRSFAESERAEEKSGVECGKCGSKSAERVFSVFGTRSGGGSSPSRGGAPMGGGGGARGGSCCGGGGCGCG